MKSHFYELVSKPTQSKEALEEEMAELLAGGFKLVNHKTEKVTVWTWEKEETEQPTQ